MTSSTNSSAATNQKFYVAVAGACPITTNDLNLTRFTLAKFLVNFAHVRLLTTEAQYGEVQAGFSFLDKAMTLAKANKADPSTEILVKFNERRSADVFTKLFNKLKWENKQMKARLLESGDGDKEEMKK